MYGEVVKMKMIDHRGYARFSDDSTRTSWEHIRIAEAKLGRRLGKDECVHHVDRDKTNNTLENLIVFRSNADHVRLHKAKVPTEILQTKDGSHIVVLDQQPCSVCNRLFVPSDLYQKYCSVSCYLNERRQRLPRVDAEVLAKQVWEMPTTAVARLYGVSGKAVEKWCTKLGIPKPGRGYWVRKEFGYE